MKRFIALVVALVAVIALGGGLVWADNPETGNGAPSGWHFNLNLVGVDQGHENDWTSSGYQGHVIFVPLWGKCDIGLQMGDYQVLDKSCLDGDRAEFQLPDPADDADADNMLEYSVYVRALTPGSADIRTCFTDSTGTFCNAGDLIVSLNKVTPPKFANVSKELLQVCVDTDPTAGTNYQLVPLFSDPLADYFWHYDNNGLRLAQLRFYPLQTTAQGGTCTQGPHPAH